MIFLTCEMPIPAELLNFKFPNGQMAKIEYATAESLPFAQVHTVGITPSVLREINNPAELERQIQTAASHNCHVYWLEQKEKKTVDEFADVLP
jgi:hypothetical protein